MELFRLTNRSLIRELFGLANRSGSWFKYILFMTEHDTGLGRAKKLCLGSYLDWPTDHGVI